MPSLNAELEVKQSPVREPRSPTRVSQELHIHHHYHVSTPKSEVRKPRKKRLGLTTGAVAPPALYNPSTPPHGVMMRHSSAPHSRKNSIRSNRWSSFSEQPSESAMSSTPSSPHSNYRSSVFDPPTGSFPGSPTTSIDPMSPGWRPAHQKQPSGMSARSFQAPICFPFGPAPPTIAHPIAEESSDGTEIPTEVASMTDGSVADDEASRIPGVIDDGYPLSPGEATDFDCPPVTGRLRRALSHESIVSLSGGLDIHTLKSRPSQLAIRQLGSASSVTGSSIVTARPMLSVGSTKRSSTLLRDSFGSSPVGSLRSHNSDASSQQQQQSHELSKIGKWVGWRLWGGSGAGISARTDGSQRSISAQSAKEKDATKNSSRPPGINQPGSVPGFSEYLAAAAKMKAPATKTTPDVVDCEALREGLSE